MVEKYKKISREIGFSYLITILQVLFAPLIVALLTRVLGPGRYGAYVLLFAFISFGSLVLQLGISQYLMTKLQSYEKKSWPLHFFSLLSCELLVLVIFVIVFYFTPISALFLGSIKILGYSSILALALITMFFTTTGRTYDYYYRARQKINTANFMEFLRSQMWVGVLLVFYILFRGFNLAHVFIAWASFTILSFVIYSLLEWKNIARLKLKDLQFSLTKPALIFGLPLAIGSIFGWIMTYADRYVLALYASTSVVGIYSVAASIFGILLTLSAVTSNVMLPYFAEAWWKDKKKYGTYLNATIKYGLLILIPGIVGTIMLRSELVTLLAGPRYLAAAPLVFILAPYPLFAFLAGIFSNILLLYDKPRLALYIGSVGAVINIGLNILLVPVYGMPGAATSIVLSNFFVLAATGYSTRSGYLINFKFIKAERILISAILMGALLFFLHPVNAVTKVLTVLLGAGIFSATIFLTGVFNKNELKLIKSFFPVTK